MISQQESSVRQFSVFFIYIQQGDKHYTDRMEAHQLRYVLHGEMTVDDGRQQLKVGSGQCVFLRRDHRIKTRKYPLDKEDFQCITLVFQRDFLRTYFRELDRPSLDSSLPRFDESVILLPRLLALLSADDRFYPTLFDFAESWKIDILDFLNSNYMYEFTLSELANYTGRSLATFKRDFAKVSSLSPEKWLLNRRLEAAYDLLSKGKGNIGVTDAAYKVGFKNRSHFTKSFKEPLGSRLRK